MSSNNDQITVVVETDTGQAEYKKFQKMMAKGQGEAVEEAEQNMHRETELPDQQANMAAEKKPEKQDQAQQTKEQMKEAIKQRLADERQQENTHSNRM